MEIRAEEQRDHAAVRAVNTAAFERPAEANLVDLLRRQAEPIISLVAEEDGAVIGHILFTPVTLSGHAELKLMGLGPVAVAPAQQRRGVGGKLIYAGIEQCTQHGYGAVVVLGHPGYYPRFGFRPSTHFGFRSEFDVPDDVFMALELQPGYLSGASGVIRYHEAFRGV